MTDDKMRAGTSARERAAAERQAVARRRAIKAFMEEQGLKPAEWARTAGLPNANSLYNLLNGESRSMSQATLEKLARAAGVSVAEIIGERRVASQSVPMVPVLVEAASGDWRRTYEVAERRPMLMPVPPGVPVDEAARITDTHCSAIYRPGTVVGIQNLGTLGKRGLLHGDRVLLHRVRGREHEVTIRQVMEDGPQTRRSAELVYTSNDKRYGARIPIPDWPYEGQWWEVEGDRLQIRGRVLLGLIMDDAA